MTIVDSFFLEKRRLKTAKKKHFWTFFNNLKTVHTIQTKLSTVILRHIRVL